MTLPLITASELALALSDPAVRIFDVRHDLGNHAAGHEAFDHSHIPGARYLDHEAQLSAPKTGKNGRHPLPTREAFAALMAQEGVSPQTRVVAYDASGGMFAAHLWWMLRWLGHANVAVLDGGWQGWLAGNHPVTSEPTAAATPAPAQPLAPTLAQTVDAQTVLANIQRPAFTVLDARAANRYRGEFEPMDPVAGHIPGALNRPNVDNLQVDGRFKPAADLRAEFEAVLAGRAPESIVHQCGSGITASHNLLAMEVAGLSGSRLYPGSWSEWVSDSSRPVATGN